MPDPAFRTLSEEDYLRIEEISSVKRECVDGFVYAQAGATNAHNLICSNIHFALYLSARAKGCFVYPSYMKVRIKTSRGIKYYYPDIAVNRAPLNPDALYMTQPCLIVEVLSKGTHKIDESYKAEHYLSLDSLQAYLLVDARSRVSVIHRRTPEGWVY
ncbi:Uma2 family endonuclease [Deinococcus rubellus]|uniref:Uma2 family endonuclease n=1 Tax=Deinococcus rubellus TaxID=1889240 RepID=A0ABY5YE13_9DEIO|nr:Uma2 family endonuclease [Deinococcus rubellus]UWX63329.1 Uma2 family endonuclease [Deinococcus rubellus]